MGAAAVASNCGDDADLRTTVRHSYVTRSKTVAIIGRMTITSLVVMILIAGQAAPPLTFGDRAAAEAATQAYREAWLSNDPQRIMSTLTPDAVLYLEHAATDRRPRRDP